ncbi:hypothetical protein ACMFMG_000714 [Clarireedia jacksonii]
MSSYISASPHLVDAQDQPSRDFIDSLALNTQHLPNAQFDSTLLSPYNQSRTISTSTSPYNIGSTPVESISEYSNIGSDFSEFDDPFFGVDFDANISRIDSLPATLTLPKATSNTPPSAHRNFTSIKSQKSSEAPTTTTFPLSPKNTSIPNTPSPRSEIYESKNSTIIAYHGIDNDSYPSEYPFPALTSTLSSLQLTPDNSGSSHTSAESLEPTSMAFRAQSPHVTVSHWPDEQSHTFAPAGGHYGEPITTDFRDYQFPSERVGQNAQAAARRDDDGVWRVNNTTGLAGLGPEERRLLSNVEVPSLKQQETRRQIDDKNTEVQQWFERGNGISDPNEPRSRESIYKAQAENGGIPLVDDAASIRDNRLLDGQVYFDIKGTPPTEVDQELMSQPRTFSDPPVLPYMTVTTYQPPTANDAIQKWNGNADTFSVISRAATWGTRRRSEPSLMDYEAVADGSFLKKLSIKQERKGPNSNFAGRLADMVRKRSTSNLKRGRSSSNLAQEATNEPAPKPNPLGALAPPPRTSSFGKSKKPTPSLNTAIAAMAGPLAAVGTGQHARSGSISATSPKSPLHLGLASFVKRGRSKSELPASTQTSLAGLWRGHGGPPVPNLTSKSAIEPDTKQLPLTAEPLDQDDDEDEEDEQADEGDMRVEAGPSEPIIPTYDGFKDHVRRLNPDMDPKYNWLVSRIAHQQELRYKNLLDLRVKHMQAIRNRNCTARPHCIALGGSATLYDAKGKPRESPDRSAGGLQLVTDFSDDSNPGEGALSTETFPKGVPMPPTRNLPAEFECQLCFKAKKFQKPSDWTKHVHEDVQPFTCTYDKCREPKSFKRKADWVRHENERHRHLEWWICQMDDCRHPCYRKDNFLQHLVREHKLPEPKQKTKATIKKARTTELAWIMLEKCHHETTNMPQDEPCKFCGKTFTSWKKLTVHLAKHMEHISLPVLRLVEQKNVDADTIISPVEQNMTPITPISRTKLEDSSPYTMATISPNIPMMHQFTAGFQPPTGYPTSGASPPYNMMPQSMSSNQFPGFPSAFNVQLVSQPRQFNAMDAATLGNMQSTQAFRPDTAFTSNLANVQQTNQPHQFNAMNAATLGMSTRALGSDTAFTSNPVNQSRGYGSMDSMHQTPAFNEPPDFSIRQTFVTTSPAVTTYPAPNMLGINDTTNFGFDSLSGAPMQNYQQVPMSRDQGSSSSYGHSPQNMQYYGQQ